VISHTLKTSDNSTATLRSRFDCNCRCNWSTLRRLY